MADPNANILSLSLPTDLLTGAGGSAGSGGLNINYNFGPNVDTIANNAYSFLGSRLDAANTFAGTSFAATNKFLTDSTAPIINAVAGESDSYFTQLLGAFNSSQSVQASLGAQAIGAQQQLGNASINSSNDSSGGGSIFSSIFGGCFITTALCKYSGRPDDCDLLQTMRAWRDGWMQETEARRTMVESYYICAPHYVALISAKHDSYQREVWGELERLIMTACHHIKRGSNQLALSYYLAAVTFARTASREVMA